MTAVRTTLWWATALAAALLAASFTSHGNGLSGTGWFAEPVWTYIFLAGTVGALMVAQARSHARAAAFPPPDPRNRRNGPRPPLDPLQ